MNDKRYWKILLLAGAITIGFWSLFYTNRLVEILHREEVKKVKLFADALKLQLTLDEENTEAFGFVAGIISQNETIPVVLADEKGNHIYSVNLDSTRTGDPEYIQAKIAEMKQDNDPLEVEYEPGKKQYIYYQDSTILTLLTYFPFVQLSVIGVFIFISYLAFSASRKSEQNRVWVGMAKETAHQLGTPISSMMAWVDYLKAPDTRNHTEALFELEKDVTRLERIAERFSKIGSAPDLKAENMFEVLLKSVDYIQKRVSKQVQFKVLPPENKPYAYINLSLFDWVIENICKNAIDAMEGKGAIVVQISEDLRYVYIDIRDTGKGIAPNKLKTVFNPGYTTKKRGWGLGLSLSKRIIEHYHNGKIFVKDSEINSGTTFRIILPKADKHGTNIGV